MQSVGQVAKDLLAVGRRRPKNKSEIYVASFRIIEADFYFYRINTTIFPLSARFAFLHCCEPKKIQFQFRFRQSCSIRWTDGSSCECPNDIGHFVRALLRNLRTLESWIRLHEDEGSDDMSSRVGRRRRLHKVTKLNKNKCKEIKLYILNFVLYKKEERVNTKHVHMEWQPKSPLYTKPKFRFLRSLLLA